MPEVDAPRFRGVIHQGAAVVAGAAGVALLGATGWRWPVAVYVASLVVMLGTSACFHRGTWSARAQAWWQRADHAAIFVAIAGGYTPLCALGMAPGPGRTLLAVVWGGAALGVIRALAWPHAPRAVVAGLYVALGWALVLALPAVARGTGVPLLAIILAGGAADTVGAAIYARRWPDPWPRTFGYHELFHALTVIGATAHFGVVAALARTA